VSARSLALLALAVPVLAGCAAPPPAAKVLTAAVLQVPPSPAAAEASARSGPLVEGFPDVVPVPPGGRVTGSAVQPRGDLLAVSVAGSSPLTVPTLLAWFRSRLRAEGFTATDDSLLPAGAAGAAYGRPGGVELLLVAVVDRGASRSWSVGGTVATRPGRG
jgi:hypothetical protein